MSRVASSLWGSYEVAFGTVRGSFTQGPSEHVTWQGLSDISTGAPMAAETRVNCGSVAKAVTAHLVTSIWANREERARITLGSVLPGLPRPHADVTIESCLTHSSGLWDFRSLLSLIGEKSSYTYGVSEALELATRQPGVVRGFENQYSNTNYLLLGVALERHAGMTLPELVRDELGGDVGNFVTNPRTIVPSRARGYEIWEDGEMREFTAFVDGRGSSNFWANAHELSRALRRLTADFTRAPSYGALSLSDHRHYVAGRDGGFRVGAVVDTASHCCDVLLTNDPELDPLSELAGATTPELHDVAPVFPEGASRGTSRVPPPRELVIDALGVNLSFAVDEEGSVRLSADGRHLATLLPAPDHDGWSDGHIDVFERGGRQFLSVNHAKGLPLSPGASGPMVRPEDAYMSLTMEPLPSALRSLGADLLREHWRTTDRDRLMSVFGELSACIARTAGGTVVELGCYKGAMSAWMRAVLDFCESTREIHVFDSFEGLPKPSLIDGEHLQEGDVKASPEDVAEVHALHGLRPPVVHAGWFSDSLRELPDEVAFAYIDADFYESVRDAMIAVLPRLVPGGTIVMDDYADVESNPRAWGELAGVKAAWDDVTRGELDVDVIVGFGDLAFGVHRAPTTRAR